MFEVKCGFFVYVFFVMMFFCGLVWIWIVVFIIVWLWEKIMEWKLEFCVVVVCGKDEFCGILYG